MFAPNKPTFWGWDIMYAPSPFRSLPGVEAYFLSVVISFVSLGIKCRCKVEYVPTGLCRFAELVLWQRPHNAHFTLVRNLTFSYSSSFSLELHAYWYWLKCFWHLILFCTFVLKIWPFYLYFYAFISFAVFKSVFIAIFKYIFYTILSKPLRCGLCFFYEAVYKPCYVK